MPAVFQKTVEQDLHKPLKIQYCADTVFTKDNAGNLINVLLFEDSVPYNGGGTVSATAIRADGATESWAGTISGNTVSVALTRAALDVPGTLQVFIKVTAGTVETTVYAGVYNVVCTETPTVVAPVTPSDVAALIASIEAAIRNIPADWTSFLGTIAPTFEPDKADGYAAGAYVWYPGQPDNVGTLYRFTSAHSGTWTGTDATQVVIGNELNTLSNGLSGLGYQVSVNTTDIDVVKRTIGSGLDPNNTVKSQLDGIKADIGTVPDGQNLQGEVSDLKSAIDETQDVVIVKDAGIDIGSLVEGNTVNSVSGANTAVSYGTRTNYIDFDVPILIRFDFDLDTYQYDIFTYSIHSVDNVVDNPTKSKWANESRMFVFVPNGTAPCMRIGIMRKDMQTMTTDMTDPTSDFYKIASGIKLYRVTDTSLSYSGIPADAKATKDFINAVAGTSVSLGVERRSAIQSSDDLNTYMTPGNYYYGDGAINIVNMSNKPESLVNNFIMFVFATINAQRMVQIIQESSLKPAIYERYYNGTKWTTWKRTLTDADIDVNVLSASSENVIPVRTAEEVNTNGIRVVSDGKGTYKISGTATTGTVYNLYQNTAAFPKNIKPGLTYRIIFSCPSLYTRLRVGYYKEGEWVSLSDGDYDAVFTIPEDAEGFRARFYFYANELNSPEFVVHPQMYVLNSAGDIFSRLDPAYYPPMLTIIDDDGYGWFYRDLMPLCVAKNAPIASAVVTGYMGQREGYMTWEQVQACYVAGCEILSHGYNHKTDADILADENTAEEIEQWYRMAKHDLQLHGIKSDILVFNNNTANVIQCQQAAHRVYKGAIHAAGAAINGPDANPYYIKRFNFTAGSHDEPHTLQEMIDNIDALVTAGTGWDCWMIHTSSTGGWSSDEVTKLGAAIDYARAHGVLVTTVEHAMRVYYGIS